MKTHVDYSADYRNSNIRFFLRKIVNTRISDKKIRSIGELIERVKNDRRSVDGPVWFRGHNSQHWRLFPSISRKNLKKKEVDYLREFKQDGTLLVEPRPMHDYEWLFIMRHHDIPTRLLDWTESPLVAAYFATYDKKSKADGVIWSLLPLEFNKSIKGLLDYSALPTFEENEDMKAYSPLNYEGSTNANSPPIAFLAPRNSARMQAQLSVFTISHGSKIPIDKVDNGKYVWKYIIPNSAKERIRKELELLKINRFQLFPELARIQDKIMEK